MMIRVSTDIKDFIAIDQRYIKELSTENVILERIVNKVMSDEEISQKVKEEILEYAGKEWFRIIEKDKEIFWKGTKQ